MVLTAVTLAWAIAMLRCSWFTEPFSLFSRSLVSEASVHTHTHTQTHKHTHTQTHTHTHTIIEYIDAK